jgi:hypothetical protein
VGIAWYRIWTRKQHIYFVAQRLQYSDHFFRKLPLSTPCSHSRWQNGGRSGFRFVEDGTHLFCVRYMALPENLSASWYAYERGLGYLARLHKPLIPATNGANGAVCRPRTSLALPRE